MTKKNFDARVTTVFDAMGTNYEEINSLMKDVALGHEVFANGEAVSKEEANDKIREFSLNILGISNPKDSKEVRRALRDNAQSWFDIIEDTLEVTVQTGLQENEWFNTLVDSRTIDYHDRIDFYVDDDAVLSVAKAGESHNSHLIQRIGGGRKFSVETARYAVKVGADINKYIAGQVDWAALVAKITEAFVKTIQTMIFNEIDNITSKMTVTTGFVGSGALDSSNKGDFDDIVSNVSYANNGAGVVIMGSKSALKKITGMATVSWGAEAQKNSVMTTGNIGLYEGVELVEIPNRFADKTYNQSRMVFDNNKLYIMPVIGDEGKFVKFVDEGDTEISEINEKDSKYTSDIMTYQVQRRFGVGVVIGRQIGQWTITA